MKKNWRPIQKIRLYCQDKTNNGRNRTTKLRKNENTQRKGKLLFLGKIKSRHLQTSRDRKKNYIRRTRKFLETKFRKRNLVKVINTWAVLLVRYSELFLKRTRRELQQIDRTIKKAARGLISDRWHRLYVDKDEENSPALKVARIHQNNDSKTS